jgi:uncharacterized membrane-anchored protein
LPESVLSISCSLDERVGVSKLPIITAVFWIMKIVATTLGETGGDLVAQTLGVGYLTSSALFVALFAVSLAAQLRAKRFGCGSSAVM